MKKAASVYLRADIFQEDVKLLALWLQNRRVTQYLNEDAMVVGDLHRMLEEVPAPMLRCQFNRQGRFFMVCAEGIGPIGFVKLREQTVHGCYEIVFAIGDERLWGNGYGVRAVQAALSQAFLEWRAKYVTAKIYHGNARSVATVCRCGFRETKRLEKLSDFGLSSEGYLAAMLQKRPALQYGN